MHSHTHPDLKNSLPHFLSGGGDMGKRVREYDWAQTELGLPQFWPQSLKTSVSICLSSNFPICIYWGNEHILIYNDAWSTIPGRKHPWALGKTGKEVWPEIWDDIEPWFHTTFSGHPVGANDQLLFMERHGYPEECFFDFTFTPIYGDSGKVEGVFNAVIETTYRVINERRSSLFQQLSGVLNVAETTEQACQQAIKVVSSEKRDVVFSAIYLAQNDTFHKVASDFPGIEGIVDLSDSHGQLALKMNECRVQNKSIITSTAGLFNDIPFSYWGDKTEQALIVPLFAPTGKVNGFFIGGFSPRRKADSYYQDFLENVGRMISNGINNVTSLQEERRKTESLAELDKAKTTFFSNISHEFRTPLTLLLGPVEELLNEPSLLEEHKKLLDISYRNGLRLQKLVNTLLEFSRIEVGRLQGSFVAVDICSFTKDLASTFRSAIEKSGLQLIVECHDIDDEIYVDIDMWEKIVLNLISNAFKFTREGFIAVTLGRVDSMLVLTVRDTGVGISSQHLNNIFDRFYRVEGVNGRSQEGTGIGLAMVKELVKLHAGNITVESEFGNGSVFTVTMPVGKNHLPLNQVVQTKNEVQPSSHAKYFAQEALQWIPGDKENGYDPAEPLIITENDSVLTKVILLADDNGDMQQYIKRLLTPQYRVVIAANGKEAFDKAVADKPDLILSDIMMPGVDGFGLLKKIREAEDIKNVPFIFLSARAGEESKIEGLMAGADDYIVKPFSARELIAKVDVQLKLKHARDKELVGALTDVHDQKTIAQKLEEMVYQRTKELIKSNQDLLQFAHVASHDLKEPVRKVKVFTNRLEYELAGKLNDQTINFFKKIHSATDRMFKMIDGVLTYSSLNASVQPMEQIDLNVIITEIKNDLEVTIQQTGAVIEYNNLPVMYGARVLIYQLFYNLINNSIKFRRRDIPPLINLWSAEEERNNQQLILITVKDNGIGFDQNEHQNIFSTFTRLNPKDQYEGTGLGLALCKSIVERHGGSIVAEGVIGEGAKFTIHLPLHHSPE